MRFVLGWMVLLLYFAVLGVGVACCLECSFTVWFGFLMFIPFVVVGICIFILIALPLERDWKCQMFDGLEFPTDEIVFGVLCLIPIVLGMWIGAHLCERVLDRPFVGLGTNHWHSQHDQQF